jgi:small subunit ribosomal protein S9
LVEQLIRNQEVGGSSPLIGFITLSFYSEGSYILMESKSIKSSRTFNVKSTKGSSIPVSHGVGRRKSCVARVWLRRGKGSISVNGKDVAQYFNTELTRLVASTPFRTLPEISQRYSVEANVQGGGLNAQADAIKLGIARALLIAQDDLRAVLRERGFLTVDSRVKERKKYGQKAARRKFQFVKR